MKKTLQLPFLDKYSRVARLYPALISLIPVFLLTLGLSQNELSDTLGDIMAIRVAGCVSINIAALFLLIQTNRFIGKEIFEKWYFEDELRMPTTDILLPSSGRISPQLRQQLEEMCYRDFGLYLPSVAEEEADSLLARRRIVEIVARMRQKVKDGHLLLQHNIEYGFARNLIGAAPLSLIISISCIVYFYNKAKPFLLFSITLASLWFLLLFLSKLIISRFGGLYAKRLIQEYSGGLGAR